MSVYCTCYIGFGFKLPFEAYRRLEDKMGLDEFERLMDSYHMSSSDYIITDVNGLSLIVDGMGGEYVFLGKIYHKFIDNEHFDVVIPTIKNSAISDFIRQEVVRIFGKQYLEGQSPEMYYIANYT